jgi:hypothetical protein
LDLPDRDQPDGYLQLARALSRAGGQILAMGTPSSLNLQPLSTAELRAERDRLRHQLDQVRVARPGGRGRPRTRVAFLTGDEAYFSRANRQALRARHVPQTIPERGGQKANRAQGGSGLGGRRPLTASAIATGIRWNG